MPDLANSRRKLKIVIGAMLAADVIAVVVLFSPLVGSADSRQLQLNLLRAELTKKTHEVEPLRGMDKKIVLAKDQIGGFYKDRFAAMKKGSILVNVARGEIIDEDALADALDADRLRGVVLDVYVGEFERPPMERLWSDPRVMITPHISGASDQDRHGGIEIFRQNLRAYIDGGELLNVIDWERGY